MTKLDILQDVLANGARKIKVGRRMMWLDHTTASVMLHVAQALNPKNRVRFLAMEWDRMAEIAWRLAK